MPSRFYEVEHSTDILNSLIKFNDLQDFHAAFKIVAPDSRRRDFDSKISKGIFKDIKGRVDFIPYEDLVKIHSAVVSLSGLGSNLD